jgi:hypothetical protein
LSGIIAALDADCVEEEQAMSNERKSKSHKKAKTKIPPADKLIKKTRKSDDIELKEQELKRVSGGSFTHKMDYKPG